jgi:thioesterase domain-containing protein/acyl carrier protein
VGYPVEDTEVLLLNEAKYETAVLGEIAIKSAHVALGYWGQPEASKARFLPDPHGSEKRIYCTGDMGRLLSDGSIEFLGRKDFQVKIRGYRVELGEVETVLNQHPSICHTVVMAHEGEPGEKRLVAYIVPAEAQALTADDLRRFLRGKLPDYMIPCAFVFLEVLPLTPNGKVDRRALPVPDIDCSEVEYVAPRNALEAQLVNLWESVLGVRPIGVTDDFFDLGGHSLLGVRLFTQIEKLFGKQLALATLFQAPTVEQLANVLHQDNWSPPWTSLVAIQPKGCKPPFYCIHEVDGNVLYYRDLAMHLGSDQPFFGLQAQGLDGKHPPIARFEDIAAHYVAEIRSFQPNGPYFLGGSSLGGMVAFEMAQQLYAQGQKVALLALFDTWSPGYLTLQKLPLPYLVSRHLEALSHLGLLERLAYIRDRAVARLNPIKWMTQHYNKIRWWTMHNACRVYQSQGWPLPHMLLNFYVKETIIHARKNYVPKPYPGKVTFFLAGDRPPRYYHDPRLDRESLIAAGFTDSKNVETVWQQVSALGWGVLAAGGLEIIQVPGKHADIVREPHVPVLAEKLRMCMESGS